MNLNSKEVALVMAVVVALGNVVTTRWARGQVTPVSTPRNNTLHDSMSRFVILCRSLLIPAPVETIESEPASATVPIHDSSF